MSKGVVFYQSVSRGLSNPEGQQPIYYLGKVYRIPKSQHGTIQQLEWELNPDDLLAEVPVAPATRIQRLPEGVIERFEVYDHDSGDVWVMYRVPYQILAC